MGLSSVAASAAAQTEVEVTTEYEFKKMPRSVSHLDVPYEQCPAWAFALNTFFNQRVMDFVIALFTGICAFAASRLAELPSRWRLRFIWETA